MAFSRIGRECDFDCGQCCAIGRRGVLLLALLELGAQPLHFRIRLLRLHLGRVALAHHPLDQFLLQRLGFVDLAGLVQRGHAIEGLRETGRVQMPDSVLGNELRVFLRLLRGELLNQGRDDLRHPIRGLVPNLLHNRGVAGLELLVNLARVADVLLHLREPGLPIAIVLGAESIEQRLDLAHFAHGGIQALVGSNLAYLVVEALDVLEDFGFACRIALGFGLAALVSKVLPQRVRLLAPVQLVVRAACVVFRSGCCIDCCRI